MKYLDILQLTLNIILRGKEKWPNAGWDNFQRGFIVGQVLEKKNFWVSA